jgi:hypothetical protein
MPEKVNRRDEARRKVVELILVSNLPKCNHRDLNIYLALEKAIGSLLHLPIIPHTYQSG